MQREKTKTVTQEQNVKMIDLNDVM